MAFSRRFPRDVKGSPYPVWEEVYLSEEEESRLEKEHHALTLDLMKECLDDAKRLLAEREFADDQESVIAVATALFNQRARHAVFVKEEAVKEKFDKAYRKP